MNKKLIIFRIIVVISVILYPFFRYLSINSLFLAPFIYIPSLIFRPKKIKAFVLDLVVFLGIALFIFFDKTGSLNRAENILYAMIAAIFIWIGFITYQRYRRIDPFE